MDYLYLHGFNSDGEGWKANALRQHFPESKVWAPDLPASPQAVIELLQEFSFNDTADLLVIGTSLGGFYAYWFSAYYQVPALLFNPSLRPYHTLRGRGIGHFKTWTKQRDYHFKVSYLAQLEKLKLAADSRIDTSRLRFFLATDDDLLDHSSLPATYPDAQFTWIDGAGHGFSKFEKVLKQGKRGGWLY